jgi:hypothetical protein
VLTDLQQESGIGMMENEDDDILKTSTYKNRILQGYL